MTFQLIDPTPPSPTTVPSGHPAQFETLRHILLGSLNAVQATIKSLHKRGYAEPNDWSKPLPTGRPNEVMAILTQKVHPDSN